MGSVEIREAQENLGRVFAANPEKARIKNPPATAALGEGLKFRITGPNGESAETDMPRAVGGGATGPGPGWFLRAAAASCTASVIVMRAAKLGIALDTLEVTVESESDSRGMLGLDDKVSPALSGLRTHIRIGAAAADAGQLREIALWSDRHSPVASTLRGGAENPVDVDVV